MLLFYGLLMTSRLLNHYEVEKWETSPKPACKPDRMDPVYKCEQPNDPCYFYPNGHDNTHLFMPDLNSYFNALPLKGGCDKTTELLVGIKIRPCEFEARTFIRQNWGHAYMRRYTTSLIFVVGYDEDETINRKVDEEIRIYGDILRLDIEENYRNLSLKAYGLLQYAANYCRTKCLVSLDGDSTANIRGLEQLCESTKRNKFEIHGKVIQNGYVNRQIHEKWYRPSYIYPNDTYPTYISGSAYMMSGFNIAQKLLDGLRKTDWHKSENRRRMCDDVMFTGIVREAMGIKAVNNQGMGCSFCEMTDPTEFVKQFRWCEPTRRILTPISFENQGLLQDQEAAWKTMKEVMETRDRCR